MAPKECAGHPRAGRSGPAPFPPPAGSVCKIGPRGVKASYTREARSWGWLRTWHYILMERFLHASSACAGGTECRSIVRMKFTRSERQNGGSSRAYRIPRTPSMMPSSCSKTANMMRFGSRCAARIKREVRPAVSSINSRDQVMTPHAWGRIGPWAGARERMRAVHRPTAHLTPLWVR